MEVEPRFMDPHAEVAQHTNRLPHWQQNEATYFVTFRLADSVPAELLRQWEQEREAWIRWNPEPWSPKQEREYRERFSITMEHWLDAGHGECLLRQPPLARIVGDALCHFDGVRYAQHAWVVMPNHVHALFSVRGEAKMPAIIQSWKSFTSRAINGHLDRIGPLWQKDYRDRMVRSARHFFNCANYIRTNPVVASLPSCEYLHYESKAVRMLLGTEG
ncbi:protein of unknown function DUF1568 [Chthoniobacter flavus Ellin428]|uniref:Transposase IS200-like domain-containing protein n=1 Tax=Chthoniobacter flavus Ellin428 TaxID=497964 RepID=B4D300_9BACT|nr:transposase [Chthoniobacter flavus]EDY19111.1 protein of unknown function DUF1568 [Chthoniobacter flavus Ellin428]TCO86869.1 transposase IS200 family protein [Chthoniobacter flavus]